MGKLIRRTVTITITESWTIVWTDDVQADDKPQPPAPTIVQDQQKPQEEQVETLQTTPSDTDPGKPSVSDPTAPPTPDGVSPTPGRQRKRGRRGAG